MLLLDVNAISCSLDEGNADHARFAPVREFLIDRFGRFAVGGTKYLQELGRLTRYLALIDELEKRGQVHRVSSDLVDKEESRISDLEDSADFDDPHIIALVIVARVSVVATADTRSDRFIVSAKFYPSKFRRPRIYHDARHKSLLARLPCVPRR